MSASEQGVLNAQYNTESLRQAAVIEAMRPFVLLKPRMFPDGNKWCALYGNNLQEGVAGFGDTPDAASRDFDAAWRGHKGEQT